MEDSAPSDSLPPEPPMHGKAPTSPRTLAVAGAALALSLFVTVGAFVQFINPAFGIWFTELFVFLGLGWVMLRFNGWRPTVYTGLTPAPRAATLFGFLLGVANFFALVVPIQYAAQALAPKWLTKLFDASRLFEGQTSVELALILTGVSVAAPLCEEFFFRGIFQKGLTPRAPASPMRALVVSSVVFSAFHLDPVGFAARTELGLLFGYLYLRTGSLWPSIGAHAANNLVSSVLFLAAKALGQDASDAETDPRAVLALAGLGIIGLLGLLSAARHHPVLWGGQARATEEDAHEPRPFPSLARLLLPWVVAATLALGALAAVDARGISLNFHDAQHPLPELEKDAPAGLLAEREALRVLRASARRGETPMEAYYEERERQKHAHRRALGEPKPPEPAEQPAPASP
ncbi:CPBP family intramembrane glutamic endopeptidase [Pyxidicoccus sp. 3LFB2]